MTKYVYSPSLGGHVEVEDAGTGAKPTKTRQRRRARLKSTWAQIPHHRGIELAKCAQAPALAVLLILEHLIHGAKSNRVKLTNDLCNQYGITRPAKARGLLQLAKAGVVNVEQVGNGAPAVTHLWYTKNGKLKGSA
jgi:hypothetical protein